MNDDLRRQKFDAYGFLSDSEAPFTEQNGRYPAQAEFEKLIFADVMSKLDLRPQNNLLDIGCGLGNILIPASFIVNSVTGVDHPKVVQRLSSIIKRDNITLLGGDFIDLPIEQKFDRIVSYCVLPALPNRETVLEFVNKALSILEPSGVCLLADLANSDKKKRFVESKRGKIFSKYWEQRTKDMPMTTDLTAVGELPAASFDDEFMTDLFLHIRRRGFNAYIVNQSQHLPFGNTREDILIFGPEYDDGTVNLYL